MRFITISSPPFGRRFLELVPFASHSRKSKNWNFPMRWQKYGINDQEVNMADQKTQRWWFKKDMLLSPESAWNWCFLDIPYVSNVQIFNICFTFIRWILGGMAGYNLYVYPLCSVYGMCIYIWLKFMINVGGYSIYRVSGYSMCWSYIPLHKCIQACFQVANRIELFINHLHPFTIPKWHKGLYSPSYTEIVRSHEIKIPMNQIGYIKTYQSWCFLHPSPKMQHFGVHHFGGQSPMWHDYGAGHWSDSQFGISWEDLGGKNSWQSKGPHPMPTPEEVRQFSGIHHDPLIKLALLPGGWWGGIGGVWAPLMAINSDRKKNAEGSWPETRLVGSSRVWFRGPP